MKIIAYTFSLLLLTMAILMGTNAQRIRNTFKNAWARDVALFSRAEKLPKEWKELGSLHISKDSHPLYKPAAGERVPIALTKAKNHLEVLILDATEGAQVTAIVQYDLENEHSNTLLEFGRTLKLGRYHGTLFWPDNVWDQFAP